MKGLRRLLAATLATFGLLAAPVPVFAAQAPIHFADLNWESGSLITDILRIIVEKATDCRPIPCREPPSPWRPPWPTMTSR